MQYQGDGASNAHVLKQQNLRLLPGHGYLVLATVLLHEVTQLIAFRYLGYFSRMRAIQSALGQIYKECRVVLGSLELVS